jgi:H+/Cl- antiporter ClcA
VSTFSGEPHWSRISSLTVSVGSRSLAFGPMLARGAYTNRSAAWLAKEVTASRPASVTRQRPLPAMLIAGVVSLVVGYAVLELVNVGIGFVWETIPGTWAQTPAWYVIGVLLIAAVLVYLVRRFVGDSGHSPMGGIKVSGLTPKEYLGAILAIFASLWGGVVLGPEVALVATGSVIGGIAAKWMRITESKMVTKVVGVGALGGILALFVEPIMSGSMKLGSTPTAIEVDQLGWVVLVALIATLAVTISRLVAALIARASHAGPQLPILVGAALIIAAAALLMQAWTGQSIIYITTSGEDLITDLPTLTSASTVAAIIALKTIAYAVSLGAGFRGGPFFPAMFVGAASGLLIALVIDGGPSVPAAIVVGVIAAVIATAPMKWPIAISLGVVLGFLMGTWSLVPAALVGAIVARAIPRLGDRISPPAHYG